MLLVPQLGDCLCYPVGIGSGLMPKDEPIPEILPVSPESVRCPFCGAKSGRDCVTNSGGFSLVHVARIKAAAAMDLANKR
jgi:hypothetical protein